jgi:hypothetical protein
VPEQVLTSDGTVLERSSDEERLVEIAEKAGRGAKVEADVWRVVDTGPRAIVTLKGLTSDSVLNIRTKVGEANGGGRFKVDFKVNGRFAWTYLFELEGDPIPRRWGPPGETQASTTPGVSVPVLGGPRTAREAELERIVQELQRADAERRAREHEAREAARDAALKAISDELRALKDRPAVAAAGAPLSAEAIRFERLERDLTEQKEAAKKLAADLVAAKEAEAKAFQATLLAKIAELEKRVTEKPPAPDPLKEMKDLALAVQQNQFLQVVKDEGKKSPLVEKAIERFMTAVEKPAMHFADKLAERVQTAADQVDAAATAKEKADKVNAAAAAERKAPEGWNTFVTELMKGRGAEEAFVRESLAKFPGEIAKLITVTDKATLVAFATDVMGPASGAEVQTWSEEIIGKIVPQVVQFRASIEAIRAAAQAPQG